MKRLFEYHSSKLVMTFFLLLEAELLIKIFILLEERNHNRIAYIGFTVCTVYNIFCPQTLESCEEKPHKDTEITFNRRKRGRWSHRGGGSVSTDGQTCKRCRM